MTQDLSSEEADDYIAEYATTEEGWFLNDGCDERAEAESATFMLGETEGLSNLIRAMPWRAGRTAERVFTSDNPVAAFWPSTHSPFDFGSFAEHIYYFAVSPDVLLVLGPVPAGAVPDGPRTLEDFSIWGTSVARHVITQDATRFLYGPPPYIDRACARACLRKFNDAKLRDAVRLQGFDPTGLGHGPMTSALLRLTRRDGEEPKGVYEALEDHRQSRLPLSALRRWVDEFEYMANHPLTNTRRRGLILNFVIEAFRPLPKKGAISTAAFALQIDLFPQAFEEHAARFGMSPEELLRDMAAGR